MTRRRRFGVAVVVVAVLLSVGAACLVAVSSRNPGVKEHDHLATLGTPLVTRFSLYEVLSKLTVLVRLA